MIINLLLTKESIENDSQPPVNHGTIYPSTAIKMQMLHIKKIHIIFFLDFLKYLSVVKSIFNRTSPFFQILKNFFLPLLKLKRVLTSKAVNSNFFIREKVFL